MSVAQMARRLVADRAGHPIVSLYLDLDPERFATAPARASQVRSLIDGAHREVEHDEELPHDDRIALREDLDRVRDYLLSREPPFQGAAALAVFCSRAEDLFETVQLPRPVPGRVMIERAPYVEPLIDAAQERSWCVVLVNRRVARMFTGPADRLEETEGEKDDVRGQHDQGGWSQPRYERSIEKDVDDHLRRAAEIVTRCWRAERFAAMAIGGPAEIVPRFDAMLPEDVRSVVVPGRVEVDVATATVAQVRGEVVTLAEGDAQRREREALDQMAAGIGSGGRAVGGPEETVEALNERRVQTLLLAPDFDRPAARCGPCGLLVLEAADGVCPADGGELEPLEHLREAAVEAALTQDAEVMVVHHHPDLGPFQGIAALLRF
jgi:peptide chain release factor subunit 1